MKLAGGRYAPPPNKFVKGRRWEAEDVVFMHRSTILLHPLADIPPLTSGLRGADGFPKKVAHFWLEKGVFP